MVMGFCCLFESVTEMGCHGFRCSSRISFCNGFDDAMVLVGQLLFDLWVFFATGIDFLGDGCKAF